MPSKQGPGQVGNSSQGDATDEATAPPLSLFGVPTLRMHDGAALVFTTERPFQVLAYLAFRRGWVRRDELAALLWPDRDADKARSNLRKVLLLARRLPPGLPWAAEPAQSKASLPAPWEAPSLPSPAEAASAQASAQSSAC